MKVFTALAGTLVLAAAANAGYTGLSLEVYADAEWSAQGYVGLTTYRLYAEFDMEADGVIAVSGSTKGAMEWHSTSGVFHNDDTFDSLTAPEDYTGSPFFFWANQWDTYVTVDTTTSDGDATALSPGFEGEVGGLVGDFTTENASWYITPEDFPQGLADGFKVLIAQITVGEGEDVWGKLNLLTVMGEDLIGLEFTSIPAPGALALLGLAGLVSRRRR